jgi:hypothetical protein
MIQLKQTTPVFLVVLLLCFGVLQGVQAVVPPPEGGYPGFNTADGTKALFSLEIGSCARCSYGASERAGLKNPKSQCTSRIEQTGGENGQQSEVEYTHARNEKPRMAQI